VLKVKDMGGPKSILHNYLHEFAFQNAHILQTGNSSNFPFMLPCIVIDLFLNNQQDALIIQICVSGIFSATHQEVSTVHSALVVSMEVFDDRFQAESGWNCSSVLTVIKHLHEIYQCGMYSRKLLKMGTEDARNM
jgi:hypothetical protein